MCIELELAYKIFENVSKNSLFISTKLYPTHPNQFVGAKKDRVVYYIKLYFMF